MGFIEDIAGNSPSHPNKTVHVKPWVLPVTEELGCDLPNLYMNDGCLQWRKYLIQAATPNDTKLNFSLKQRYLVPKARFDLIPSQNIPAYPKPNGRNLFTNAYEDRDTDIKFCKTVTPNFPIWVEKVKICLHQHCTFGCIKVNVWVYPTCTGEGELVCKESSSIPVNLVGLDYGQGVASDANFPVTIIPYNKLISNALNTGDTEKNDLYMEGTDQTTFVRPMQWNGAKPSWMDYGDDRLIIPPKSIIEFGIQYAESDAYGLKVFIVGWALECEDVGAPTSGFDSYTPVV
jgi:hypothetical protein